MSQDSCLAQAAIDLANVTSSRPHCCTAELYRTSDGDAPLSSIVGGLTTSSTERSFLSDSADLSSGVEPLTWYGDPMSRAPSLRTRQVAALLLGAMSSLACAASSTSKPAQEAEPSSASSAPDAVKKQPEDIQKLFAREAGPIAKQPVAVPGAWTAYIEAKAPPNIEKSDNLLTITADLGWEMELRCYVYDKVIDAGGAANTMIKAAATKVSFKALSAYFFDHSALSPIIGIRGIYNVEQNGVMLAGDYKLVIMPRLEHPVMCEHDAPGYAASFARVASEFAKSFQFQTQQAEPARGELWAVTLDGNPVGFTQSLTYKGDSNQIRQTNLSARFIPRGPGELLFEDEATVITSNKEGELLTGRYVTYENGEPTLTMDVERKPKGYEYVGTVQDKELRGSFKSKQPLLSDYAAQKRLGTLSQAKKKATFDQFEYTPSIDPAQATKVNYAATPENGKLAVQVSTGQRGLVMSVNDKGVVDQILMPVGSKNVQADLVEEVGARP